MAARIFPFCTTALHYSPEKLQDTILKSNLFTVKEGHVDNYDELDSDYIFDCRGFPTNFDDYRELKNPLNSVLSRQVEGGPHPEHTLAIAKKLTNRLKDQEKWLEEKLQLLKDSEIKLNNEIDNFILKGES